MSEHYQYRFLRHAPRDGTTMQMRPTRFERLHIDLWLLFLLLLAALVGLITLYSASAQDWGMVIRQAISFGIGLVVMLTLAQIPPRIYQGFSPWFYTMGLLLLLAVMLIGEVRMGARRWIGVPGFGSVQPSEFMKLGMPMMIAWFFANRVLPPSIPAVIGALLLILLPVLLIARQPDLGTSLVVMSTGVFVLFLAGLRWWKIGLAVGSLAVIVPIMWQFVMHDYQKRRVLTLFNPEADALGAGWNIIQSKIAIGSGGLMGKGFTEGTQSHLGYLPEHHTDFIMSTYAEEFGFIGVVILFSLYAAIIIRCFMIGLNSFNNFGRLIVGSLALSFFLYVVVNSGMVSGIFPVTGDPLPFMSYGGTAIITLLAGFGIVMSVHTHR